MPIGAKKAEAAFPFYPSIKGTLGNKTRRESLSTAIQLILTTPKGKIVYNPSFGSHIPNLVFDILNDSVVNLLYHYTEKDLQQDPRIKVTNISIGNPEAHRVVIYVNYFDQNDPEQIQQQTNVEFAKEI